MGCLPHSEAATASSQCVLATVPAAVRPISHRRFQPDAHAKQKREKKAIRTIKDAPLKTSLTALTSCSSSLALSLQCWRQSRPGDTEMDPPARPPTIEPIETENYATRNPIQT